MKKLKVLFCALALMFVQATPIHAEDAVPTDTDFENNLDYYTKLCTGDNSGWGEKETAACRAYSSYLQRHSTEFAAAVKDIEDKLPEIQANIQTYVEQVRDYDSQIADLNNQIADINADILVKEDEIAKKQESIDQTQAEVDELKAQILSRMEASQSTMRLNQYLDIIMGAKDLNDLIRRTNVIQDITTHDESTRVRLVALMEKLSQEKAELEEVKAALDEQKAQIVVLQAEAMAKRQEAAYVKQYYQEQEAELQAQQAAYSSAAASVSAIMANIGTETLNSIEASPGWTYPVSGGSVGTSGHAWYRNVDSGSLHLGNDIVASRGSAVLAVGNGVILNSADGCGDGYLGSTCGGAGGVIMGGNQIYLLTTINGGLYAISYNHLESGTLIATGTIVVAGQQVAQVGTSGNSSGPHCHIEVFFLGSQSLSSYASNWNGDMSFGTGWGYTGAAHSCESTGYAAPCRVRPESVFGG